MTAVIFPGQGSQILGMAKDFNDNYEVARSIFTEIEDSCSLNIRDIIFNNTKNLLNQTNYTQLSIFSASVAIYKTLESEFSKEKLNIKFMLGHSLGEYSALACSEIINISTSAKLLKIRGDLMNTALEPNKSGMAALIGLNCSEIQKIIENENLNIEIANDNSPMQIVISGLNEFIDKSEKLFLSKGVKKFVKLNVSSAFHSKFMFEAQEKLKDKIDEVKFNKSDISIISNFNASINNKPEDIIHSLKNQMSNKVKWTESIQNLENINENQIIEIGPGRVLSGLIKRISKSFDIRSIDNISDLQSFKLTWK